MSSDLLLITPLFHGSASGAAVYYRLLSGFLQSEGRSVAVVSDRERGKFPGTYIGLFPRRCGRERRRLHDLAAYALQNALYMALPGLVRRLSPRTVLVHSSFYNHPGVFPRVIRRLAALRPRPRLVADVRDQLMPPAVVPELNLYDAVVACSENVARHLSSHGCRRFEVIPVLQERLAVDPAGVLELKRSLGLDSAPYLFYAGLVKEQKGLVRLLSAYGLARRLMPELRLVVAGLLKTDDPALLRALDGPGVHYVGNLPRDRVLQLMAGAALCVNLSPREGMPRASLEALALGRPVFLPPGVPEFDRHCAVFVANGAGSQALAERVVSLVRSGESPEYPVEVHLPEAVLPLYRRVLGFER